MQQLALWGNFRSTNDKWGWAVGTWTLGCHASQLGYGSLALSPADSTYQVGATAYTVIHTPEPGDVRGCFPPCGGGTLGGWWATPVSDPHPSPARTGFFISGLTQVAASTPIGDALTPGPPASCRCHWFLGEDVSVQLAGQMKVCSRLWPVAGFEVLRRLRYPIWTRVYDLV